MEASLFLGGPCTQKVPPPDCGTYPTVLVNTFGVPVALVVSLSPPTPPG